MLEASWQALCLVFVHLCIGLGECSDGREFAVRAVDYKRQWGSGLSLGDCVHAAGLSNSRPSTTGLRFTGQKQHIDTRRTDLKFRKLETSLDSHTRTMGGGGVGVDFLGLFGASVQVRVTVTVKLKRNTLTMESTLDVGRGMDTLTHATPGKEVTRNPEKCPFYLSEIVYGGQERLVVQFEFENKKKVTETEIKITIKVLFFKITIKMRFIKTTRTGGGRCSVVQISTYSDQRSKQAFEQRFTKDEFSKAIIAVETAERRMENLPTKLNSMSSDNLHLYYYFSKSVIGNVYKPSILANQWAFEKAKLQFVELQKTEQEIAEDLQTRSAALTATVARQLQNLRNQVSGLKSQIESKLKNFHNLSPSQLTSLRTTYGVSRAPGYYHRQHRKIIPEEQFVVCERASLPTTGVSKYTRDGYSLTECSKECQANSRCKMYTFKESDRNRPATGRCTFLTSINSCSRAGSDGSTTLVITEKSPCAANRLGLSSCTVQGFVDSDD